MMKTKPKHNMMFLLFMLAVTCIPALCVNAQSGTTPTPAPSKTPTPEVSLTTSVVPEPDATQTQVQLRPFTQTELFVLTGNVQRPNAAVWHDGVLYTACNGDWTVYQIDDKSGSTTTYIYGIRNAHTLYVEDGSVNEIYIWVPDFELNTLFRVNRNRSPQSIATNLDGPWGIVPFEEDSFLITNLLGNSITAVDRRGNVREVVTGLRSPAGIATDGTYVYVANNGSSRRAIEWFGKEDISGSQAQDSIARPLVSGLQNTTGLALGEDGYLYFSYALGTRGVGGRVDPAECQEGGGCASDQTEIVLYTELAAPLAGLTLSSDMRLFIHTIFKPEIYWAQLATP
jgi:glucose/arabinose dehydrogenase